MNIALILAGGQAKRFGKQKLLELLHGRPVLYWCLDTFSMHPDIDSIILIAARRDMKAMSLIARNFQKIDSIIEGGKTRYESVKKGLRVIQSKNENDTIIIHNAANPFVTSDEISEVLISSRETGAAGVGRKIFSTIRQISADNSEVISRVGIYGMETPQSLQLGILKNGIEKWDEEKTEPPTDDLQLAEILGHIPEIIPVHFQNRKITTLEDLAFLERLKNFPEMRIGIGEDSHEFTDKEKKCILGGIVIPYTPGFAGNSDGDIVYHALSNAISSALGGNSFSEIADELHEKGETNSEKFFQHYLTEIQRMNIIIENISLVFEGNRPKLESFFPDMRSHLAGVMNISEKRIGLTAHSGETLSSFGHGKGMRVLASVLLRIWT